MSSKHLFIILIVLITALLAYSFFGPNSGYKGADHEIKHTIEHSGYQPWFANIWTPPSGEVETFIFSIQAAGGALVLGYYLGKIRGKKEVR